MISALPDPATLARIGAGASADVLLLPDGRALKLLLPGIGEGVARREFDATLTAYRAGLPVPAPLTQVTVAGRHGLVLERLDEPRWMRRGRRLPGAVMATLDRLARAQAAAHRVAVGPGELAPVHAVLGARLLESNAPVAAIDAAAAALARLPTGDRLLHGDLHLGNVVTAGGRMFLIDWSQAMAGDPAADVARSELVMRFGRHGHWLRRWPALHVARDAAAEWYLFRYRRLTGLSEAAIDAWRLPVAVAWLRDGSAAHVPALTAWVERRMARPR